MASGSEGLSVTWKTIQSQRFPAVSTRQFWGRPKKMTSTEAWHPPCQGLDYWSGSSWTSEVQIASVLQAPRWCCTVICWTDLSHVCLACPLSRHITHPLWRVDCSWASFLRIWSTQLLMMGHPLAEAALCIWENSPRGEFFFKFN